ncbi:MAG: hypothetical protein HYX69_01730 [Planctomycetia bacterium]|nr:hypothetical protein [Planctomycetia bacterium]
MMETRRGWYCARERIGEPPFASPPSESWLFAQAALGKCATDSPEQATAAPAAQELSEWVATVSTGPGPRRAHSAPQPDEALLFAQELRGDPPIDEEVLRDWVAAITGCEDTTSVCEGEWDPAKHPRGGYSQNVGWFLSAGTSGGESHASDPSRWYLRSEEKGTWLGAKGDSKLRLNKAINVDGKLVKEIEYKKGVPLLHKFVHPGKTVAIVLTGDNRVEAPQIRATNKYGPNGRVDPHEVRHALRIYREQMGSANYLKTQGPRSFDFGAAAARAKEELRTRLTGASQRHAPQQLGPVY